jgi:hypothetical protein
MDSEDSYDHKQLSFSGLAEAMQGIRMQVACDMRMPMLKIFGTPATGLNAGDEDSIEVYNSMVESEVRNKIKYPILRMLEIKSQKLFGFVPDDLSITFKPLRVLSAEQEENVKTQKYTRLIQAKQTGEITTLEFRDACNKGNLFDITLDTVQNQIDIGGPDDTAAEGQNDPKAPQDEADPGSGRIDTRKPVVGKGGINKEPPAPKSADAPRAKAMALSKGEGTRGTGVVLDQPDEWGEPRKKVKNYTLLDRLNRIMYNSAEYDRASYEADGGDEWIDPRREEFFSNPGNVDEALWSKAKKASEDAFGEHRWQFVVYMYKKFGGKFS